ncbi:uncharacterized protein LOC120529786 [Polypterus senegalus]|uniref:uncharacterized protein LOC120529786 n=1 Tax=Polypterus senegalus TaxID=55291 RepID=UPI0019636646|nr:uncharacterized protein LOC120529786 [Polypterus senegalus]XP_039609855.1 uncharacterized protein LOC120529786 [Polypterus senegalus]
MELTEDYKQKIVDQVIDSLKGGISTTIQLMRDMQAVDCDHMKGKSRKIRKSILNAEKQFSKAESSAMCQVRKVDDECLNLICEKNQLENEEKDKKEVLYSLQKDLEHLEEMLRISKKSLSQAHSSLQSAEQSVNKARKRVRDEERNRNIGIGLMFVPIVGTFIGAAMIIAAENAKNDAEYAARVAQENVDSCKSNIATNEGNIQDCTKKVDSQRNDIDSINRCLRDISSKLESLSRMRLEMGEVQKKLKDATFFLSTLAGKMQAAKFQTKTLIFFDPLINILDDIAQYLCKQKYLELFQQHIEPMIKQLKNENTRLKSICKNDSDAIQFY